MDPAQIPLRDIHLPSPIDWWPFAPGWWFLIALAAVGVAVLLHRAWRLFRDNRPRRIALKKLSGVRRAYQAGTEPVLLATQASQLLRRAMLAYAAREDIAGLTGSRWLEWLDRGLDQPLFSDGAGRLLESLPYVSPGQIDEDDVDLANMLEAVRIRIQTPLPGVPH